MLVATGLTQPVEKPGALQLAIREWQRQLIEIAEEAKQRAPAAPASVGYWEPEGDGDQSPGFAS